MRSKIICSAGYRGAPAGVIKAVRRRGRADQLRLAQEAERRNKELQTLGLYHLGQAMKLLTGAA